MNINQLKLNCDMGEGYGVYAMGRDEEIMPYIDMANLACGFHAADPVMMHRSIQLAKAEHVAIGAHPSFPDLQGFGRREMSCSTEEIVAMVLYQCGALEGLCKSHDQKISYVKPHGALYNVMMKDLEVFKAICKAISKYDATLPLMILSTSQNDRFKTIAGKYNIHLLYEIFADRAYTEEGYLVARSEKGAVLSNEEDVLERAKLLMETGTIKTITGKKIALKADTLCVHADTKNALELIKTLRRLLNS